MTTTTVGTETERPVSGGGGGTSTERVTVNLNHRASAALEDVVAIVGGTKTDAINRALIIYKELSELQANGGRVYIREKAGELEGLRIL
jgi:hypothetical protein